MSRAMSRAAPRSRPAAHPYPRSLTSFDQFPIGAQVPYRGHAAAHLLVEPSQVVVRLGGGELTRFMQQPSEVGVRVGVHGIELDGPAVRIAGFLGTARLDLAAELVPILGRHANGG